MIILFEYTVYWVAYLFVAVMSVSRNVVYVGYLFH